MKSCTRCERQLDADMFDKLDGRLRSWCKDCSRVSAVASKRAKRLRDVNRLLEQQGGKCAICQEPISTDAHIDHDHRCCPKNKWCSECLRGLLCPSCNLGLGFFKDSTAKLRGAIDYLESWVYIGDQSLAPYGAA